MALKKFELLNHLWERSTNMAVITETKKKLKGTRDIDDFVMIYSGVPQKQLAELQCCWVKNWKKIVCYNFFSERKNIVGLKKERGCLSIFGLHAPKNGRKEETEMFY